VNLAAKIAIKNTINPVFECIYIKVEDHSLIVKATNLEVVFEKNLNILGEINGEVFIRSEILSKVLNSFARNTNDGLEIERKDNLLVIKNQKSVVEIDLYDGEQGFVNTPAVLNEIFTVKSNILVEGIKNVSFASSKNDIKPEIAAVYIYKNNEDLYFVATDSYRLAESKFFVNESNKKDDFNIIVPIKNITSVISILEELDSEISIGKYEDGIVVNSNNTYLTIKTVEGNYPDYRQLFPKDFEYVIEVEKESVVKSLNISNLITTQYNFSNFTFDLNSKKLIISAKEKSRGSSRQEIDLDIVKMPESLSEEEAQIDINYNTNYILEGLQKIHGDKLVLSFNAPNKPLFIRSSNSLVFNYLITPINR
jgi:DNA polymerase-3 subunit beta